MAYNRSRKVDWGDKARLQWLTYAGLSSDVRNIPSWKGTTGKRTVSDVQIKSWVGVVSIVSKTGNTNNLAEAAHVVSSVLDDSADLPDLAAEVSILENKTVEKDTLGIPRILRPKMTFEHPICSVYKSLVVRMVFRSRVMSNGSKK